MKLPLHGFEPVISSFRQIILAFAMLLAVALQTHSTWAQTAEQPVAAASSGIVAEQRPLIDDLKKQISGYQQKFKDKADADAALADLRLDSGSDGKKASRDRRIISSSID